MVISTIKSILLVLLVTNICKSKSSDLITADENKPITIFTLLQHGLGSNLINMITFKSYFESIGHTFIVDESHYYYSYKGKSVLSVFFEYDFSLLKDKNEFDEFMGKNINSTQIIRTTTDHGSLRRHIKKNLPHLTYDFLSPKVCSSISFSKIGIRHANQYKLTSSIPDFSNTISVGFHVRRGDKIKLNESRIFTGKEYVQKLIEITTERIDNCFIASDDYNAVTEIKAALKSHKVGCKVYSFVGREQNGNVQGSMVDSELLKFITELTILSKVTYFIGTFNSNVGTLVSLLRGCYTKESLHSYHSYGVDKDAFFCKC